MFFSKLKGGGKSPPIPSLNELFWSWIGSAIGIGICAYLSSFYFVKWDLLLIIGSFGASAVLTYAAIESPLAQPRNLVGGHIVSALVGVACYKLMGNTPWLASSMAVSIAIVAMLATGTLHPPGGATALIAVIGSGRVHNLGFMYILIPAGLGAIVLLLVGLVTNNLAKSRKYPLYWY